MNNSASYLYENEEIRAYRQKLFKWDKLLTSILPLLVLGGLGYYLLGKIEILYYVFSVCVFFGLSLKYVNQQNFRVAKIIHYICVYAAITLASLWFDFLRFEYFIFLPLLITTFICYPNRDRRLNWVIVFVYSVTAAFLWVNEFIYFGAEYFISDAAVRTFNHFFGGAIIYIGVVTIVFAVLIQHKALEFGNRALEQLRLSEQKYRQNEAMLRTVLDSAPIGIYAWDLAYNIIAINKQCKEDFILQYNLVLNPGDNLKEKAPPEKFERWDKEYYQLIFAGEGFHLTGYFKEDDDEKRQFVQNSYVPLTDEEGHILGGIELSLDLTELDNKERALRRSEALLRHIFDSSTDAIEIITLKEDKTPLIIERNSKYKDIFRKRKNSHKNAQGIMDVSPERQKNGRLSTELMKEYKAVFKRDKVVTHDWQIYDDNGALVDLEIKVFEAEVNDTNCIVGIFRDVTEKKQQEAIIQQQLQDLNKQNIELQKYINSNMQLENFAYIASHDLQSPIRTIVSFTQLLERSLGTRINKEEKEYMDFIVSATKNMQGLIQDLLLFSRANTTELRYSTFDVFNLVRELKQELASAINEQQAVITFDIPFKMLVADRQKLKQVFQNLLVNALKFIPAEKTPIIHISGVDRKSFWTFSVQDNGIGIEETYKEKIFMLFKRLHTADEFEGTGIGLALCKKIVERHGGTIEVQSELGEGSTFVFTISKKMDEAQTTTN